MNNAAPSDFVPEITENMVNVFCKFPVPHIERLIRTVEEKHHYGYGGLVGKLLDILDRSVKELGAKLTNSCVFDDVSVIVQYDETLPLSTIKNNIARACFYFWQHFLSFTVEAQNALKGA